MWVNYWGVGWGWGQGLCCPPQKLLGELLPPPPSSYAYEIRGVLRIIQRYFFLFLNENICFDPSLEPSLGVTALMMGRNIRFKGVKLSLFTPSYMER